MDTLKGVSQSSPPSQPRDDKYKPVAPETMYETFMSDSEEEGGKLLILLLLFLNDKNIYFYCFIQQVKIQC